MEFKLNGETYEMSQARYDAFLGIAKEDAPNASAAALEKAIALMCKSFKKAAKELVAAERDGAITSLQGKLNGDEGVKVSCGRAAAAYTAYAAGKSAIETALGGTAKITEAGNISVTLPLASEVTLATIAQQLGTPTFSVFKNDAGETKVRIVGDCPTMTQGKTAYMAALSELDGVITTVLNSINAPDGRTGLKTQYDPERGLVVLSDCVQKQAGAPATSTPSLTVNKQPHGGKGCTGGVIVRDDTKKEYRGTHQELRDQLLADGFHLSPSTEKYKQYFFLTNGRVPGITCKERWTSETAAA